METSPYMDSAQSMLGDNDWGRGGGEAQCQPTMFPIFKPARTMHIYRKLSTEWMVRHPQLHSPEIARERKQGEGWRGRFKETGERRWKKWKYFLSPVVIPVCTHGTVSHCLLFLNGFLSLFCVGFRIELDTSGFAEITHSTG